MFRRKYSAGLQAEYKEKRGGRKRKTLREFPDI